jgi:23S rRNA pseudouridine955/2504/2580 synthase
MAEVERRRVMQDEADLRLDRWFKRHYPGLPFGRLAKLLRTGQVRVDGKRADPGDRLQAGAEIRVPPLEAGEERPKPRPAPVREEDAAILRQSVIYEDADIIAINKPAGLAVQGGTGMAKHVDAMLDALARKGERPRLVHRIDKDTSGVLLLARTAKAAAYLTKAFREGGIEKTYWALTVGIPKIAQGEIDMPVGKVGGPHGEQMGYDEDGQKAKTLYEVLDMAGRRIAWLALRPLTGRTHQLRVHCAAIGTPILGDRKYGGPDVMVEGFEKRLHLHARLLRFKDMGGRRREVAAPLPPHMEKAWKFLELERDRSAFEDLEP